MSNRSCIENKELKSKHMHVYGKGPLNLIPPEDPTHQSTIYLVKDVKYMKKKKKTTSKRKNQTHETSQASIPRPGRAEYTTQTAGQVVPTAAKKKKGTSRWRKQHPFVYRQTEHTAKINGEIMATTRNRQPALLRMDGDRGTTRPRPSERTRNGEVGNMNNASSCYSSSAACANSR